MDCSPRLCSFDPGSPKPARPPRRSTISTPIEFRPWPTVLFGNCPSQSDALPTCVNGTSKSSIARIELSGDGAGAIGKALHPHGRCGAEAGHGLIPDLADLFPAVAADGFGDRAEGKVRNPAAQVRV